MVRFTVLYIRFNQPVPEPDDPVGEMSDIVFVCYDEDGDSRIVDFLQEFHHFDGCLGVECAGRFVSKNDFWFGY